MFTRSRKLNHAQQCTLSPRGSLPHSYIHPRATQQLYTLTLKDFSEDRGLITTPWEGPQLLGFMNVEIGSNGWNIRTVTSVVIFTTGLPGICFPPAVFGPQHIHKKYFHAIFSSPAVPGTWLCCPQSHEPSWLPACIPTHQAAGWPCSDGFSLVFLAQDDARCMRDWATQTLNPKPQTSCKPFNSVAVLFHV